MPFKAWLVMTKAKIERKCKPQRLIESLEIIVWQQLISYFAEKKRAGSYHAKFVQWNVLP
jgi:hypothetical protein